MNKEEKREYNKKWRLAHLEYSKQWRLSHKRQSAQHAKRHYQKDKLYPKNFCIDCGKGISPMAKLCLQCCLRKRNIETPYIRTPEIREKNRQSQLRRFENPKVLATYMDYLRKATIAPRSHTKPNKAEIKLAELLNRLYPNEWRFTGNGDYWIGTLNPDFIHNNDKKLAIELFGDYWHNRKGLPYHNSELGRTMFFNSHNYKSLIIWEYELKDIPTLTAKIIKWYKTK